MAEIAALISTSVSCLATLTERMVRLSREGKREKAEAARIEKEALAAKLSKLTTAEKALHYLEEMRHAAFRIQRKETAEKKPMCDAGDRAIAHFNARNFENALVEAKQARDLAAGCKRHGVAELPDIIRFGNNAMSLLQQVIQYNASVFDMPSVSDENAGKLFCAPDARKRPRD